MIQCYNIIKNGKFEDPTLAPWSSASTLCKIERNMGDNVKPAVSKFINVNLPVLADSADAVTVPEDTEESPRCDLFQEASINVPAGVNLEHAQLSWVDRITSMGNRFGESQYAKIKLSHSAVVFETTNDNTDTGSVKTFQRIADITTLVGGVTSDGELKIKVNLEEEASMWPMYFQLDNVELWVCFSAAVPDQAGLESRYDE
jgi:hypothetical protein